MEAILEENQRVLFVEVSVGESCLLVYQLGELESDRISTSVPSKSAEPPFKRNEQRHLNHLEWHLKATATRAYHLFQERSCTGLILMGEKQVMASLEEFLHEAVRANIVGRINRIVGDEHLEVPVTWSRYETICPSLSRATLMIGWSIVRTVAPK